MKLVFNVLFADTVTTEITNMKQGTRITCAVWCLNKVRKKLCKPAPFYVSEKTREHDRARSVNTQACIGENLHVLKSRKSLKFNGYLVLHPNS